MSYKQGGNPLSRKSSPLNARNPFSRVSPLNMKTEDGQSHKELRKADKLKEHKAEFHNKGGDPQQDDEARQEDMGQQANQPLGPERRSSKSPLNKHDEWQTKIDAARAKWEKEKPEGDFYEVHADLFKKQEEARKAHKEGPSRKSSSPLNDGKSERAKRNAAYNNDDDKEEDKKEPKEDTSISDQRNKAYNRDDADKGQEKNVAKKDKTKSKPKTAKDTKHVSGKGRQGTNRQERKARRKERRAIRKDKTLSRSQKTMAKKESRAQQKENIKGKKIEKK